MNIVHHRGAEYTEKTIFMICRERIPRRDGMQALAKHEVSAVMLKKGLLFSAV